MQSWTACWKRRCITKALSNFFRRTHPSLTQWKLKNSCVFNPRDGEHISFVQVAHRIKLRQLKLF